MPTTVNNPGYALLGLSGKQRICMRATGDLSNHGKLLNPTKQETKLLTKAYDAGWNDYREIIYNCYQLYGEPLSMQEIIDWGSEWYMFESSDIPLGE